jgi:hypothetical protein
VKDGGIPCGTAGRGFIYLEESSAHNSAMYAMGAGSVNFVTGSTVGAIFVATTTTPAAGHASVAFDGTANYRIFNNIGSAVTFTVISFRTGTGA